MIKDTQISQSQFDYISRTVYNFCGIRLTKEKHTLVNSRLTKRLYALNLKSFDEYLQLVEKDKKEFSKMIDSLTTNKTNFFREIHHFDFLQKQILPNIHSRRLRIWSAACSSGEEPYSIGMLLHEVIPDIRSWDVKILATDISANILQKAHKAEYSEDQMAGISSSLKQKYFAKAQTNKYVIRETIKNMVSFARLNLMGEWKMKGPFDVIFCRNVMIYFDKTTQGDLVNRFYNFLPSGGYLLIGHSESLNGIKHNYRYVQPAVYLK